MSSLPRTDIKTSKLAVILVVLVTLSYFVLLQVFWVPVLLRAFLYLTVITFIFLYFFDAVCKKKAQISINDKQAFLFEWRTSSESAALIRLEFVRANGVQLIAKTFKEKEGWFDKLWPAYRVIYCDSLGHEEYATVRSFAAQQVLLNQSKKKKGKQGFK